MTSLLSPPSSISPPRYFSNSTTRVILVRHGRTTYNQQGRYQGSSDESTLTEQGHQDAYNTGIALRQYDFEAIYTSPLSRVKQTTQEITSALNCPDVPVYIEPRLTEVCMSDWQGLLYQEVKEQYPDDYQCWQQTPHLFTRNQINYPVLDLFEQAKLFWSSVLNKHRGQTILIVAHGGTNRALIGTAIALSPHHYHSLQQCNCGISCLEFSDNNNLAQLKYLNLTNHLLKPLPKLKAGKQGWRWLLLSNNIAQDQLSNSGLLKVLNQGLINLVLTDGCPKSSAIADKLLVDNKQILSFSIDSDIFIDSWQKTIARRQKKQSGSQSQGTKLITSLIIASDQLISNILHQSIDIKSALNLTNNLAVIHYPQLEKRSILQGLLPLTLNLPNHLASVPELEVVER
ncbi:MAG: histidine phosphatase family protein [Cyanobacteria bacterium P01_G01_bin.39]